MPEGQARAAAFRVVPRAVLAAALLLTGCATEEPRFSVPMPAENPAPRPPMPVQETPRNPAASGGTRAALGTGLAG